MFKDFPFLREGVVPKTRRTQEINAFDGVDPVFGVTDLRGSVGSAAELENLAGPLTDVGRTNAPAAAERMSGVRGFVDAPVLPSVVQRDTFGTYVRRSQIASVGLWPEDEAESRVDGPGGQLPEVVVTVPISHDEGRGFSTSHGATARSRLNNLRRSLTTGLKVPNRTDPNLKIPSPIAEAPEPSSSATNPRPMPHHRHQRHDIEIPESLIPSRVGVAIPPSLRPGRQHPQPQGQTRSKGHLRRSHSFAGWASDSEASPNSTRLPFAYQVRAGPEGEQAFHDALWAYVAEIRKGFSLEDAVDDSRIWGE